MTKSKLMIAIVVSVVFVGGAYFFLRATPIPFTHVPIQSDANILYLDEINEPYYDTFNPMILVASSQTINDFQSLITSKSFEILEKSTDSTSLIIAAFQGTVHYNPSGIDVEKIDIKENIITVHTYIKSKNKLTAQGGSFSHVDIVMIDSSVLNPEFDTFTIIMVDQDNELLAETTYHRP